MVDFVLKLRSELGTDEFIKKIMLGVLRPQASDTFGLNPLSQLAIGYHWLAFLNHVRKNLQVPDQFTYTIIIIINTIITHYLT